MKCLLIGDALPKREYYRTLEQLIPELKDGKPGLLKSREFPFLSSVIADGRNKLP